MPAAVRPFRALHFDPARVRLDEVVSPPYDVISPSEHEALLARSPYNVVRLILPEDGHEERAAGDLAAWRSQGVLAQDDAPCLYRLEQEFTGPDGVRRLRSGFLGLVRLEPYAARVVRPHERTLSAPKEGRLRLLRATRAQLSPIFLLYRDPSGQAAAALDAHRDDAPLLDVTDAAGSRHRLWRVTAGHAEIAAAVAESPLLIADGHHRYETALGFQAEEGATGDAPAAWTLAYLVEAEDPGLVVFPTHRVVAGVDAATREDLPRLLREAGLAVAEAPADAEALEAALAASAGVAFAVWRPGAPGLICTSADPVPVAAALPDAPAVVRELDVAVLQALVLGPILGLTPEAVAKTGRITYTHRAAEAASVAAAAADAIAVLLRAPSVASVESIAKAGATMPQKSTYFYPKVLDGMVFYPLEEDA